MQETLLRTIGYKLRVPKYRTFSVRGEHAASTRGVVLLLRSGLHRYTVGASPWCILVRVFGEEIGNLMIMGSLCIPSDALETQPLKTGLGYILNILSKYPSNARVVMGDYNRATIELLSKWQNVWVRRTQNAQRKNQTKGVGSSPFLTKVY